MDGRGRRYKHFQLLTEDIGNANLASQLASVTTLMKVSRSWGEFKRLFDRASRPPDASFNYQMDMGETEDEDGASD